MAKTELRVRVPVVKGKAPFSGVVYGLEFKGGVSEAIHDKELYERLVMKGYEPYTEARTKNKAK
jgi:hypothetical protein